MKKDLLSIEDLTYDDMQRIFELTARLKASRGADSDRPLAGKTIGMIFAKSSTRTRVSFEVGINELGGFPMYMDQAKMQVGRGETVADTAKVLDRYLHGLVIRTYSHKDVEELAANADFPVINALTDDYHPCQVLADLFTIQEHYGSLAGVKLVFVGDGSCNMGSSLILGAKLAGLNMVIAAPEEFRPRQDLMDLDFGTGTVTWEVDPAKAVIDADFIYTDVWVSMGCEEERAHRLEVLQPYQLNTELVSRAGSDVKVLHCLPAHRGEEITDEVMDSPNAIVFDEAENRLHVQKAVMSLLIK
jgi:ornithine carbamoyltransferase